MWSVPNNCIDDDSLKKYFYQGQDVNVANDNGKGVLDTIAGGSYGIWTWAQINEKMQKLSHNNKAWSTRMLYSTRNIFAVQDTNISTTDNIHEKMVLITTELGFVFKHVSMDTEGECSELFD